jgi:hypothetical protein
MQECEEAMGARLGVIPAVVAAGDRKASKAVYGRSKVYLELGGRALVAHVVVALQSVPEVSEVWVVGDEDRLRAVFAQEDIRKEIHKPLHLVGQFRNLYENLWHTFRRMLPGAGVDGRDPEPGDEDRQVLYLSADLPFATAQEISQFIQRSFEVDCDYTLGLVTEESMASFYPEAPGKPGIRMAYFNLREGRYRTGNLHLVKPVRIVNRRYIEEMYEHRYQKQFGHIIKLAWTLVKTEEGGLRILGLYLPIHLAGMFNRRGWRRLADRFRARVPLDAVARCISSLLRADFQFVITDVGGCGLDIDNERDYDVAAEAFEKWKSGQLERAQHLYGSLPKAANSDGAIADEESES